MPGETTGGPRETAGRGLPGAERATRRAETAGSTATPASAGRASTASALRPRPARSRGTEQEPFVQTARAVALQIEADIAVADRLELAHDGGGGFPFNRAGHLVARDLDAGKIVVVAHAVHLEAERAQRLLGSFDHAQ